MNRETIVLGLLALVFAVLMLRNILKGGKSARFQVDSTGLLASLRHPFGHRWFWREAAHWMTCAVIAHNLLVMAHMDDSILIIVAAILRGIWFIAALIAGFVRDKYRQFAR